MQVKKLVFLARMEGHRKNYHGSEVKSVYILLRGDFQD